MDNYADNLKKIRELAEEVKILDLLNPSSDVVNLLTEIIDRCKKKHEHIFRSPLHPRRYAIYFTITW